MRIKSVAIGISLALLSLALFYGVVKSPPSFGSIHNLPLNVYLPETLQATGALNTVAALVWDWRGYDTLGETTVFFAAAIGTVLLFRLKGEED